MLVSNCNQTQLVNCGCGITILEYTNNAINKLEVGNLIGIGTNCILEKYIVDWHLDTADGPIVLVSGTPDTSNDIQQYHPFMGSAGRYVEVPPGRASILYVPVLRKFWINGVDYYPSHVRCRRWCDIESDLPSITILKASCSTDSNSDDALYNYKMEYVGLASPLGRVQTANFYINSDTKWLAFKFVGGAITDTVNFYFRDNATPIPHSSYEVSTGEIVFDGNNVPYSYDDTSIRVVLDLTEGGTRVLHDDDYIRIEVIGGETGTTDWSLYLKCLSENTFSADCNYFTQDVRTIVLSSISVIPPATNCENTVVRFNMLSSLASFTASLLNKYISMRRIYIQSNHLNLQTEDPAVTSSNYNYETGAASLFLRNKVTFISTVVYTGSNRYAVTEKRFYWAHSKSKGCLVISFHDQLTFRSSRDDYSYVQTTQAFTLSPYWVGGVPTTPDKVGYYKTFFFRILRWRRRSDGNLEGGHYGDLSTQLHPHDITFWWHIKSTTEFSNTTPGNYDSMGAELIFTHSTMGVQFTNPTITTLTGNLDGAVIPKYLHTNDPYKPYAEWPDVAPQTTLIVLTGNSGSALITFPNGSTATITYDGNSLLSTVLGFVSSNPYSVNGVTMTCTQPGDYVNTLKVTYYKGIETDFLSFPEDPPTDPLCKGPMKSQVAWGVNRAVTTYNAADIAGNDGVYQGDGYDQFWNPQQPSLTAVAINAYSHYDRLDFDNVVTLNVGIRFAFKSLNSVCTSGMNDSTGWWLNGAGNNSYEFWIFRIRVEFPAYNPDYLDREHYVIYDMMDSTSGQLLPSAQWRILKDTRV